MEDCAANNEASNFREVLTIKGQANAKFKEQDYFSAKCLYSGALELLEKCCMHVESFDETWEALKNNMAFCDLKRKEWSRVVDTTSEILRRNPRNAKALYRRGVANAGQSKLAEARRDLLLLLDIEPKNVEARQMMEEFRQQMNKTQIIEKHQANKLRGFLHGERLNDTVPVGGNGGVRKMHGNENAPLFASWMRREWMSEEGRFAAVVTCHIVITTQCGKEVWSSRNPAGAHLAQQAGPHMANEPAPALRPVEPVRFVVDDLFGGVFEAWNCAVKTLELNEIGKFEIAAETLGPSVEKSVEKCITRWLHNNHISDASEKRKYARQILGFPEELFPQSGNTLEATTTNANSRNVADFPDTLLMQMELIEAVEFRDIFGDGHQLLRVLREGVNAVPPIVDLSTVTAHFRVAKFLLNSSVKDTRMGIVQTSEGLAMRPDKDKDPVQFVVGEEETADEDDLFVPPCLGCYLKELPGGAREGMQFELILREGCKVSDMQRSINSAYATGTIDANILPNTTGPIIMHVEIQRVAPRDVGPLDPAWLGATSFSKERSRAKHLETLHEGRHGRLALKRWRRMLRWLHQVSQSAHDQKTTMYDLEWEGDDAEVGQESSAVDALGNDATAGDNFADVLDVSTEQLRKMGELELSDWALAHASIGELLLKNSNNFPDLELAERHLRCATLAAEAGNVPKIVQVRARLQLGARFLASGRPEQALEVLKVAQVLDPSNDSVRNHIAKAIQLDCSSKAEGVKDALLSLKKGLSETVEIDDAQKLIDLLKKVDEAPLTWTAVSVTAIGKEVGKCARHADSVVADAAKAILCKFHKLAKQERPLW